MKRLFVLFTSSLSALLIPLMSAPPTESLNAKSFDGLVVEILIFSGRPNPTFTIKDPQEIREIMALVEGLPKHPTLQAKAGTSVLPSILGYKGLSVENLSKTAMDVEAFVVSHSNVQVERAVGVAGRGTRAEMRQDTAMALQHRLIASARVQGGASEEILNLIEGRPNK